MLFSTSTDFKRWQNTYSVLELIWLHLFVSIKQIASQQRASAVSGGGECQAECRPVDGRSGSPTVSRYYTLPGLH